MKAWRNFSCKSNLINVLLKSACDTPLCKNDGTCQSGFTEKKYRCLCPPGFTGEYCEHGKLFLKLSFNTIIINQRFARAVLVISYLSVYSTAYKRFA